MIDIEIPNRATLQCPRGASLMEVLVQAGWPVARACEGSGVCGKCAVRVLRGGQDLTPASDLERSSLFREGFDDEYRLSCLVKVTSPIAVQADYW